MSWYRPRNKRPVQPNEDDFKKFQVIAESGQYKVYKVKG